MTIEWVFINAISCSQMRLTAGAGIGLAHTWRWDLPGDGLVH